MARNLTQKKFFDKKRKEFIESIENSTAPFYYFILIYFGALLVRNFIELFSTKIDFGWELFIDYNMFFTALAVTLILAFHLLTGNGIKKSAKVILPAFLIVTISPVIDLVITGGKGVIMEFMIPFANQNLLVQFLTFFGNAPGITLGLRVEIALILLLFFYYFSCKSKNLLKNIFGTFVMYAIIFAYLAIPYFTLAFANLMGFDMTYYWYRHIALYLILMVIAGILMFYFSAKEELLALISDIRPFRLIHFELMFFIGFFIGLKTGLFVLEESFFPLVMMPFAILFAWVFSVIQNNIADVMIDAISNKKRPLISKKIPLEEYSNLSFLFCLIALFFGALGGFFQFFFTFLFIAAYSAYSSPPLRLKKIPLFSKLIISFNSMIIFITGFLVAGNMLVSIPIWLPLLFLIGFTLAINFIDIKDYLGDKKVGIKTLPVLLGLKKSKQVIGLFFIIAYLIGGLLLNNLVLFFIAFLLGLLQYYLINKKQYCEWPIFLVYFASIITLVALI